MQTQHVELVRNEARGGQYLPSTWIKAGKLPEIKQHLNNSYCLSRLHKLTCIQCFQPLRAGELFPNRRSDVEIPICRDGLNIKYHGTNQMKPDESRTMSHPILQYQHQPASTGINQLHNLTCLQQPSEDATCHSTFLPNELEFAKVKHGQVINLDATMMELYQHRSPNQCKWQKVHPTKVFKMFTNSASTCSDLQ